MQITFSDCVKLVTSSICMIDFVTFFIVFLVYLLYVGYKSDSIFTSFGVFCIITLFSMFKAIHIPVFLSYIKKFVPIDIPYTDILFQILIWVNILLSALPLLAACITIVKRKSNKTKEFNYKFVNIIMPIYNEEPKVLMSAIQSVRKLDYPNKKIHLFLAFDDQYITNTYKYIAQKFGITDLKEIITFTDSITISLCRFKHGGKKSAQEGAYNIIKKIYKPSLLVDSLLFFIDSDIQLKSDCLTEYVKYLQIYNKSCATGIITCKTSENLHFLSYFQDVEYISGQILWRNFENYLQTTSCLPGAFTILKWTSFNAVSKKYFGKKIYKNIFDYQRFYLGEDRYLTHLLMENEWGKIGFCEKARCKTEAPLTISGFLKQRKRWFLGHIANDTWLISSLKLWFRYPLFTLFNFLNNSRNTSIYIYLLYYVILFDNTVPFYLGLLYILLPICLNWLFIIIYAFRLNRKMNILFYIINILIQPIFYTVTMYYTLFNISKMSWGGVRVERPKSFILENNLTEHLIQNNKESDLFSLHEIVIQK